MFKTFLVPTDGSGHSANAVRTAVELATQVGGKIVGLSVVEPYPFPPIAESAYVGGSEAYEQRALELAEGHLASLERDAAAANVPCKTVVEHALNPDEAIVDAARKHHCDAILMATHGRRGLNRLFTGSVTQKVIVNASVPVIVVR